MEVDATLLEFSFPVIQGRGLAYINLAILAIEEGDGRKATGLAKTAAETLEESGHGFLNALASVVLGKAYLAYGDLQSAANVFEDILPSMMRAITHWLSPGLGAALGGSDSCRASMIKPSIGYNVRRNSSND
jgi:hypothetical protein